MLKKRLKFCLHGGDIWSYKYEWDYQKWGYQATIIESDNLSEKSNKRALLFFYSTYAMLYLWFKIVFNIMRILLRKQLVTNEYLSEKSQSVENLFSRNLTPLNV